MEGRRGHAAGEAVGSELSRSPAHDICCELGAGYFWTIRFSTTADLLWGGGGGAPAHNGGEIKWGTSFFFLFFLFFPFLSPLFSFFFFFFSFRKQDITFMFGLARRLGIFNKWLCLLVGICFARGREMGYSG